MTGYRLGSAADRRLDEIYEYTARLWGDDQAKRYLADLFATFARIGAREIVGRRPPLRLKLDAYSVRSGSHLIYWREDPVAGIEIMSILHERMDQAARLADDLT